MAETDFTLATVFEAFDIDAPRLSGQVKMRCPFPDHEDRTASFSVNFDKSVFNCPPCDRRGGVIEFIVQYKGVSWVEARHRAEKLSGGDLSKLRSGGGGGGSLLPKWARSRYGDPGNLPAWASNRPAA